MKESLKKYGKWPLLTGASDGIGLAYAHNAPVESGLINKICAFENRFLPRLWPARVFGRLIRNTMGKNSKPQLIEQRDVWRAL